MKTGLKIVALLLFTAVVFAVCSTVGTMISSQQAAIAVQSAADNMGDQTGYKAAANLLNVAQFAQWLVGLALIAGAWYFAFKSQLKKALLPMLTVLAVLAVGCQGTEVHIVTIVPPNYAITINANSPSNQTTSNNFGDGELVNLTQVQVQMAYCTVSFGVSSDKCPNIRVAQVPGSPESRIYTASAGSGTSGSNQSLQFEAQGSNGSLDFSVVAIIQKQDAKCYANKMGVKPVVDDKGKPSVYEFVATPLGDALDTRVVQIASAEFAKAVIGLNPVDLAKTKFTVFDAQKPNINKVIYDRTCITIIDEQINGGVVWSSQAVQDYIDHVILVTNQKDLVQSEYELAKARQDAFMSRFNQYRDLYGLDAAIQLMYLEKWDGTGIPLNRFTVPANIAPTSVPAPASTPAPAPKPTAKP